MALPVLSKTYQFSNNSLQGGTGVLLTNARQVMRQIKNALIGFGTLPWTVQGSSDAVAAGMDATDRWDSDSDLTWSTTTRSWIVLRNTGMSAKFEMCIDLNGSTLNSASIIISPSAGFGTTNGGTDGSITARPTATDEVVILSQGTWFDSPNTDASYRVHAQKSTDGEVTRIIVTINQVCILFATIEKPKNPIGQWTSQWVAAWRGSGAATTSAARYGDWNDTSVRLFFKPSGSLPSGNLFMATTFTIGASIGERAAGQVPHDILNTRTLTPITLGSETAGLRGLWGELFDIYWGDSAMQKATQFDASPSRLWTFFQDLVIPWDGTTQVLT